MIFFFNFRNNEKRKEKSRDAARCRRSKESEIFTDLSSALPMKAEDIEHLDKASIMRLAISFLKVRTLLELCKFKVNWIRYSTIDLNSSISILICSFSIQFLFQVPEIKNLDLPVNEDEQEDSKDIQKQLILKHIDDNQLALKALDGFLLVLSDEGDVTYVSENICEILGLSQVNISICNLHN